MTQREEAETMLARVQQLAAQGDIALARVEAHALHEFALALKDNTPESIAILSIAVRTRRVEGL
jgi:hypothetical protein